MKNWILILPLLPYFLILFVFNIQLVYGQEIAFNQEQYMETTLATADIPFNASDDSEDDSLQATNVTMNNATSPPANSVSSSTTTTTTPSTQWLLQVRGPASDRWKSLMNQYLKGQGTKLGTYYPHNTFLVKGPKTRLFRRFLQAGPGVFNAVWFMERFKISQSVQKLLNDTLNGINTTIIIKLRVRLFTDLAVESPSREDAQKVLRDFQLWRSRNISPSQQKQLSAKVLSASILLFTITNTSLLSSLVTWLSEHADVNWIEEKPQLQAFNFWANHLVQGDTLDSLPLAAQGLTGKGMIIGIGDTSLDYDSCFFADPKVAVTLNVYNPKHRKVVLYKTNVSPNNFLHGTFVCGTLAGSVYNTSSSAGAKALSTYNGLAPDAKLAFVQFSDINGNFVVTDPLGDYFGWLENEGHATISSNSWGSTIPRVYDVEAEEADAYSWKSRHFLIVFAAGNYGQDGYGTLSAAGQNKNGITVGASYSLPASYANNLGGVAAGDLLYKFIFNPGNLAIYPNWANFGPQTVNINHFRNIPLILALPTNACSLVSNELNGAIALVYDTGECDYLTQAYNVYSVGAKMLLLKTNGTRGFFPTSTNNPPLIPVVMIGETFYEKVLIASKGASITITVTQPTPNEWFLVEWSARGPTDEGRVKPDLVAPGVGIHSAKTNGYIFNGPIQCPANDVTQLSGTSMSTSMVSAMAALVQEYYNEGFYPTGKRTSSASFFPSSALVKATLIASAVSIEPTNLAQTLEINPISEPPDLGQGFGRMQLNTVLYFANDPLRDRKALWVTKRLPAISTDERHSYCFHAFPNFLNTSASSTQPFPTIRATLVWTDYPSSASQNVKLINNLDLVVVRVNDGKMWIGNQLPANAWDILNNVEQVTLRGGVVLGKGAYFAVIVNGANIPSGPQPYALVVNGHITKVDNKFCVNTPAFCPNNCTADRGFGKCNLNTGKCNCNPNRAASGCTQPNPLLIDYPSGSLVFNSTGVLQAYQNQYFRIYLNTSTCDLLTGFTVVVSTTQRGAAVDVFISSTSVPSRTDFEHAIYSPFGSYPHTDESTSWLSNFNKSTLPQGGGTMYFTVSVYCCGPSDFLVTVAFT